MREGRGRRCRDWKSQSRCAESHSLKGRTLEEKLTGERGVPEFSFGPVSAIEMHECSPVEMLSRLFDSGFWGRELG